MCQPVGKGLALIFLVFFLQVSARRLLGASRATPNQRVEKRESGFNLRKVPENNFETVRWAAVKKKCIKTVSSIVNLQIYGRPSKF